MTTVVFHEAAGEGANLYKDDVYGDFKSPGEAWIVDKLDPTVSVYDHDTVSITQSFENGEYYVTTYITDLGWDPLYVFEGVELSNSSSDVMVSFQAVSQYFNINDDLELRNVFNTDDSIFGNSYANVLNGGYGRDYISGGGGDDTPDGNSGDDYLVGGEGNDTYFIDSKNDQVTEYFGEGEEYR